ncbi:hypothetical protein BGZ54_005967 [Gamsiella multidivaricata]|nr:hypothetical protein BGZ54_005967 [Gamsiella multidivaricata]
MAEEDGSDPDMAHLELSTPYLQHIHNNNSNSYDCTVGFHPHYSGAHLPVADFDLDYDFESTQAQEDWLDAVLEDLMEEDEQEESGPEYNSEDEIDSFADNSDLHDIETLKRKGQEKVAALVAYQINFQPSRPLYA